jgi:deazaflavin-dependent oxidoreductase (nitroreductase family)
VGARYQEPGWFTRHVFNRAIAGLTRAGRPVAGSLVLAVRGRRSGEGRTTPVNLLELGGARYLVAPPGTTQWVRNLRVVGGGELRHGRRVEPFTAREVTGPADVVPVLRAYLDRWKWGVGVFFDGAGPDSTDERLAAIAPDHPVFLIELAPGQR